MNPSDYKDDSRCTECGGKCCQIYLPIEFGGGFPALHTGFLRHYDIWRERFAASGAFDAASPVYDPFEMWKNSEEAHHAINEWGDGFIYSVAIKEYGGWCEFCDPASGCILPRESRPELCRTFICQDWLNSLTTKS